MGRTSNKNSKYNENGMNNLSGKGTHSKISDCKNSSTRLGRFVSGILSASLIISGIALPSMAPGIISNNVTTSAINSLLPNRVLANSDVSIDETNFPDPGLREYIQRHFDLDSNNVLDDSEISQATEIDVRDYRVSDLKGIEYFQELTSCYVFYSDLTEADFSSNPRLEILNINMTQLTSVNVTQNPNLKELYLSNNKLENIDISKNTKLTNLNVDENSLTKLDLSKNTSLNVLSCNNNKIKSLDLSNNKHLYSISCQYTELTELDTSKLPDLLSIECLHSPIEKLDLSNNPLLDSINCFSCNLSELDLSKNPALTYISCGLNPLQKLTLGDKPNLWCLDVQGCNLDTLDISKLTKLEDLNCNDNNLTKLDLSHNPMLGTLFCHNNKLTELDLTALPALSYFRCDSNNLTSLDVSKNPHLISLTCSYNEITELDVTNNNELWYLSLADNNITSFKVVDKPVLTYLDCSGNGMKSLTLDGVNGLQALVINKNQLKTVDLSRTSLSDEDWGIISGYYDGVICDKLLTTQVGDGIAVSDDYLAYLKYIGEDEQYADTAFEYYLLNDAKMYYYRYIIIVDGSTKVTGTYFEFPTPTPEPTATPIPTATATPVPTATPSKTPTVAPTAVPTVTPSKTPTVAPTAIPTAKPTATSTPKPTATPTVVPSAAPEATPEVTPEATPVVTPEDITKPLPTSNPDIAPEKTPSVDDFAERLYTTCLGRDAEEAGKDYWSSVLKSGMTGAEVAEGFFFSPEFEARKLNNKEFIGTLYETFMGRTPADDEVAYWDSEMTNGKTHKDIFYGFINSPEWANICLTYGIRSGGLAAPTFVKEASPEVSSFAERLYTTCLGRAAEKEGLEWWATELANLRQTGTAAAQGFFSSPEFINLNTSDDEYVTRLYRTFMGREPEEAGFKFWTDELKSGKDRQYVFDGFSAAPEFADLCAEAGIMR